MTPGRLEADRIAHSSLLRALEALSVAGGLTSDTDQSRRIRDLREAVSFMTGGEGVAPRDLGLHALILLRHAVSSLRSEILAETLGSGGARLIETADGPILVLVGTSEALEALAHAHDAVDTAVSMMGGIPDLIDDPDDWLTPGDETEMLLGADFAETAGTAAILARDGLDLLRSSLRPEQALMARDVSSLVAFSLVLRCALAVPDGSPRTAIAGVAQRGTEAFDRFQSSLSSWKLLGDAFPDKVVSRIQDVGDFARDVFDEVEAHARMAAPTL